jgi:hypothetical protein
VQVDQSTILVDKIAYITFISEPRGHGHADEIDAAGGHAPSPVGAVIIRRTGCAQRRRAATGSVAIAGPGGGTRRISADAILGALEVILARATKREAAAEHLAAGTGGERGGPVDRSKRKPTRLIAEQLLDAVGGVFGVVFDVSTA